MLRQKCLDYGTKCLWATKRKTVNNLRVIPSQKIFETFIHILCRFPPQEFSRGALQTLAVKKTYPAFPQGLLLLLI